MDIWTFKVLQSRNIEKNATSTAFLQRTDHTSVQPLLLSGLLAETDRIENV